MIVIGIHSSLQAEQYRLLHWPPLLSIKKTKGLLLHPAPFYQEVFIIFCRNMKSEPGSGDRFHIQVWRPTLPYLTGCYIFLPDPTGCYIALPDLTGCNIALPDVIALPDQTQRYIALPDLTGCYIALPDLTGCYPALTDLTGCYTALTVQTELCHTYVWMTRQNVTLSSYEDVT